MAMTKIEIKAAIRKQENKISECNSKEKKYIEKKDELIILKDKILSLKKQLEASMQIYKSNVDKVKSNRGSNLKWMDGYIDTIKGLCGNSEYNNVVYKLEEVKSGLEGKIEEIEEDIKNNRNKRITANSEKRRLEQLLKTAK